MPLLAKKGGEKKLAMVRKIKINANFGNIISRKEKITKFNTKFKKRMIGHHCTNRIIIKGCKLRCELFLHYGNIMQNLTYFLFESINNIITEVVKDFRNGRIMMLSTHESHNEFEWDF